MSENIIELHKPPEKKKKCSFCGNAVQPNKAIEAETGNLRICYACVKLATQKLKEAGITPSKPSNENT